MRVAQGLAALQVPDRLVTRLNKAFDVQVRAQAGFLQFRHGEFYNAKPIVIWPNFYDYRVHKHNLVCACEKWHTKLGNRPTSSIRFGTTIEPSDSVSLYFP
jgi:hypothetical protein